MKVFLSWSGKLSRGVAEALRDWLPSAINEIEPFVSGKDIAAGARWQAEISGELELTHFGIVCVTRENQDAPWLNFEAGALAKAVGSSRVIPLAIDLKVTDVKLPLAQFQAQPITRDGILEVLRSANAHCDRPLPEEQLRTACEVWWPRLDSKLQELLASRPPSSGTSTTERSQQDLLEEILTTVRGLQAQTGLPFPLSPGDVEHLIKRSEDQQRDLEEQRRRARAEDGLRRFAVNEISDLLPDDARFFATRTLDGELILVVETKDDVAHDVRDAVTAKAKTASATAQFAIRRS